MIAIDFTEEDIERSIMNVITILIRGCSERWRRFGSNTKAYRIVKSLVLFRLTRCGLTCATGGIDALKQLNYCPQESELLAQKTIFGQIQQLQLKKQRQKSTNSPVFNAVKVVCVCFSKT